MSFFELFNGTPVDSLDNDHRIAFNKPAIKGSKNVTWVNFRTILSGFFMNLTGNQTVNGDKTFTGRIVGRTPLSDYELATKKYVDDNAGGGEEIIEVDTYANLPAIGVNSVLYIVLDENVQYRWTGSAYIKMSNPLSYATEAEALAGTDNTKVMTSLRVNEQWNHNVVNEIVDDLDTTDKTLQGGINELAARAVFSVCEQSDVEQAIPTENTKATSALRAWQGFVYWVKNTSFSGLTTTVKTVQGAINELAANTLKGNTTEHTTPIDADSLGVWDSVAAAFKRLPLLTLYNFFVVKSTPPQEAATLHDTDVMFGARGTDARYWSFALVIQKLLGYLPKDVAYTASSWSDVQAICESQTCPASVAIHLVSDVSLGSLNTYAKNIVFLGRRVTVSSSSSIISGAAGAGTYRMTFESGLACYATEPAITFGSSENIQDWDVRIRDLSGYKTTLSVDKIAPSTCMFRYNSATNIVFAVTSVTPAQANMWYDLTSTEITTVVNVSDTPDTRYYIGNLPYGWMVESISAQAQLNTASFVYAFESLTEDVYTQWTGTIVLSGSIIFSLHGNFATVSTLPVFGNGLLGQLNPVYVNSSPSTVKSIAVVPVAMVDTITVFKLKIVKVI